jgi:hypothetical protein
MKRISIAICSALALFGTACNDYLDVNENPNVATEVSAKLILPQALTATGQVINTYNTYGSQIGGFAANAGGYGGFNETITYLYTAGNYSAGLWAPTYDNLADYQYIINQAQTDSSLIFFEAAAMIMQAYDFEKLVDAFNDIPYSQALRGAENLTPEYDAGADVYADLAAKLDTAIMKIHEGEELTAQFGESAIAQLGTADVMFGDFDNQLDLWIQLANTIKLRLMVRADGKATFDNTSFDAAGFLTMDALIDPGYTRDNGRQAPKWETWAWGYTGSAGNKAWIPTNYAMRFYDGTKIDDDYRGYATYYQYPTTGTNDLGYEGDDITKSPNGGSFWYPGTDRGGTTAGNSTGPIKGPNMSMPLFTAAESYFLQAEAILRGIIPGSAADAEFAYDMGIVMAFEYNYMLPKGGVDNAGASYDGDYFSDASAYYSDNAGNPLVDWAAATALGLEGQIEAIITQKWIALNFVNCDEAWNDYRRTGYPAVSPGDTFASVVSQSTRPDKLPTRVLYPFSESQYNASNVPTGISPISSTIFWAN